MIMFLQKPVVKSVIPLFAAVVFGAVFLIGCGGLNGTMIEPSPGPFGLCSLVVTNNYDDDMAIKLADVKNPTKTLHYVYVSAKSTAVIEKIAPGNLMMRYTKGKDWDPKTKMFLHDRANFESDAVLKFEETETETKTSDGIRKTKHYSVQQFNFNPAMGEGNTTTSQIDDKEFSGK